jgi:hypothetical protein
MFGAAVLWLERNIFDLGRQIRFSYLPPLMVYMAAGISGLTQIVGTFFVKDYLNFSAEFLAALGFWAGIPWVLKIPIGHLVDIIWRWKSALVVIGALSITVSLLIILGLLGHLEFMRRIMPAENWYVLSILLAPIGYVLQDVVADAMTVEAVPKTDCDGQPLDSATRRLMHTTMQTLGRVAIIGGGMIVALINLWMFNGVTELSPNMQAAVYIDIYRLALFIPLISVLGVILGGWHKMRHARQLSSTGIPPERLRELLGYRPDPLAPNGWILGGSLIFVVFTLLMGLGDYALNQEIVFTGSLGIVVFLMYRLLHTLEPEARRTLLGTAIIIFMFRAVPGPGAGASWWQIDRLGFDQQFLSLLSLIGSSLTLAGMFIFRRFMAERSIAYVVSVLTILGTALTLPIIGMYYGLHVWTSSLTGGVVDARFIAVVDTALDSPLGQIAMIPMLAWIANSAPPRLKATFFAVLASFTNLALSLRELGTKYLNQLFTVTRQLVDPDTQGITVPADSSELGMLLITVSLITLCLPLATIGIVKLAQLRSA